MIITVVCDVLGEENNGTTIAAMNLIRHLKSAGHEVRVLCPDENKKDWEGYYIVPKRSFGPLNGYVAKNGVSLAKPEKATVEKALCGADAVHVMVPFALGSAAAKYALEHNIALTAGFHMQSENFTNHIFMMNFGLVNTVIYKYLYHKLYRYCDCVHYPTRFICDVFETVTHPTNHYVISNGVNSRFHKTDTPKPEAFRDKFVILSTGRFSREKKQTTLIEAIALSKHNKDIQLILAGEGPQKENLIKLAQKKLANPPLLKFFSRDEMVRVINYADLYVHPAEIEIEAIACLEAIACGKVPVINNSARSATKAFALHETNLFDCNSCEDLAHRIDYWLENGEERKKCSEEYAGYAAQFDFEDCMRRMEQMIFDAVKKHETKNGNL